MRASMKNWPPRLPPDPVVFPKMKPGREKESARAMYKRLTGRELVFFPLNMSIPMPLIAPGGRRLPTITLPKRAPSTLCIHKPNLRTDEELEHYYKQRALVKERCTPKNARKLLRHMRREMGKGVFKKDDDVLYGKRPCPPPPGNTPMLSPAQSVLNIKKALSEEEVKENNNEGDDKTGTKEDDYEEDTESVDVPDIVIATNAAVDPATCSDGDKEVSQNPEKESEEVKEPTPVTNIDVEKAKVEVEPEPELELPECIDTIPVCEWLEMYRITKPDKDPMEEVKRQYKASLEETAAIMAEVARRDEESKKRADIKAEVRARAANLMSDEEKKIMRLEKKLSFGFNSASEGAEYFGLGYANLRGLDYYNRKLLKLYYEGRARVAGGKPMVYDHRRCCMESFATHCLRARNIIPPEPAPLTPVERTKIMLEEHYAKYPNSRKSSESRPKSASPMLETVSKAQYERWLETRDLYKVKYPPVRRPNTARPKDFLDEAIEKALEVYMPGDCTFRTILTATSIGAPHTSKGELERCEWCARAAKKPLTAPPRLSTKKPVTSSEKVIVARQRSAPLSSQRSGNTVKPAPRPATSGELSNSPNAKQTGEASTQTPRGRYYLPPRIRRLIFPERFKYKTLQFQERSILTSTKIVPESERLHPDSPYVIIS